MDGFFFEIWEKVIMKDFCIFEDLESVVVFLEIVCFNFVFRIDLSNNC